MCLFQHGSFLEIKNPGDEQAVDWCVESATVYSYRKHSGQYRILAGGRMAVGRATHKFLFSYVIVCHLKRPSVTQSKHYKSVTWLWVHRCS